MAELAQVKQTRRERLAEQANAKIARAADLLHTASGLADECGDEYACGRIDSLWEGLQSRDLHVAAQGPEE